MNQGICINFLCFGLFWPYFGPCNMYTKKIFHISMIATIAQLAEHCFFDLEARVQIQMWTYTFISLNLFTFEKIFKLLKPTKSSK